MIKHVKYMLLKLPGETGKLIVEVEKNFFYIFGSYLNTSTGM